MPRESSRTPEGIPILPDRIADKIKSGKTNWAVEEVVGEQAVEAVEASTRAAAGPIHAEDLRPISREEATARTTFDGESMIKAPQMRRVKPAPFKRPAINLTLPWEPQRTWQNVPAQMVEEGDVVPEVGKVADASLTVRHEVVAGVMAAVGTDVTLTGKGGVSRTYDAMEFLRVFRF